MLDLLKIGLALMVCGSALATDKPEIPTAPQSQTVTPNTLTSSPTLTASPTATAGGGQGGGASISASDKTLALGLGSTAPIPPTCPAGLVPGSKGKRGLGIMRLVDLSAVCVAPDEAQASAIEAQRAHELALARIAVEAAKAEAERDRAATERVRAEACFECSVGK